MNTTIVRPLPYRCGDMTPAERRADLLHVLSETYAVTNVIAALAGHLR